jgi:DNA-binding SARP family transcriptional activator
VTTGLVLLARVAYRDREIPGSRLPGLLALLAADLRAGCSTARLVDGLWPDEQPENPAKALQVLVSRARSQLGSDVIASTPTGYRLALSEDQVDSSAALLSAAASARHSRAGEHAAALAHAEAGLALWDGAATGDTGLDDPVSALRADRASTHRSLLRARALALSRLGRRAEAFDALTEVARDQPRDEDVLLELLRCEAAAVSPGRGARPVRGVPPLAARRARHRSRRRAAGAAPAAVAGRGARGPARCPARAQPAARP